MEASHSQHLDMKILVMNFVCLSIRYFLICFLYLLKLYLKFEASDVKHSFISGFFPSATNNTRLLRKVTLSREKTFERVQPYWCKYVFISFRFFPQVVVTKWLTNSYIVPFNSTLIYFIWTSLFFMFFGVAYPNFGFCQFSRT